MLYMTQLTVAQAAEQGGFQFTPALLATLLTGAVALVVSLGGFAWVRKKMTELTDGWAEDSKIPFISQIDDYLEAMATHFYHSTIKNLKDNDEWNKEMGRKVLSDLANSALGAFGGGNVAKAAGISTTAVKNYVEGKAEMAVGRAKAKGKAAKKVAADPSNP